MSFGSASTLLYSYRDFELADTILASALFVAGCLWYVQTQRATRAVPTRRGATLLAAGWLLAAMAGCGGGASRELEQDALRPRGLDGSAAAQTTAVDRLPVFSSSSPRRRRRMNHTAPATIPPHIIATIATTITVDPPMASPRGASSRGSARGNGTAQRWKSRATE